MSKNKIQTSVAIDREMMQQIDAIAGPMKRSRFIEAAVRAYLKDQKKDYICKLTKGAINV